MTKMKLTSKDYKKYPTLFKINEIYNLNKSSKYLEVPSNIYSAYFHFLKSDPFGVFKRTKYVLEDIGELGLFFKGKQLVIKK
jgi:hypothetical protein